VPVDPNDVYFLEAVGDHTLVRLRSKRRLRDSRRLGTLIKQFAPYGFLRIHRNHAVNLARIQEIRRRKGREDWEAKLEPPVNRVLPVSRNHIRKLLKAFREGD
jgi:DNA-binding LytR/AlgR family response regulator